ncbi:porin family protein [Marinobacter halotolerans]|uniref:porin n=1 Tax=Marinobacter halotolerans TaxID=1569211 RepID=UPI0012441B49|nr:porin [Marinobacter halotolerans]
MSFTFRSAFPPALMLAAMVPANAQADDPLVRSENDDYRLEISGQLNRALLVADDGDKTTLLNVDNNNSSSRIRFVAESTNDGPLDAGAAYEAEFTINNSASISQEEGGENNTEAFEARRAEVYLEHERLGTLWLGQGPTATDSLTQQDLSGTMNAGFSFTSLVGGGILFRDSGTGQLSNTDLGDVSDNLDGFGRNTRLRYDFPEIGDWEFRTSVINDGAVDAGAFYSSEFNDLRIEAAFGVGNASELGDINDPAAYDYQMSGSISVRNDNGYNLTFATGHAASRVSNRDDLTFFYTKAGYRSEPFPQLGNTALSVDWGQTRNEDQNNDRSDVIGVQLVQDIDVINTETYATVRRASLDRDAEQFDDLLIAMVGFRLDF